MIDYDDEEVRWWIREIEYIVRVMKFSWKEITVDHVMRELDDLYELSGSKLSDEVHEMCEDYLQQFSNPFGGLYAPMEPGEFLGLTERGRNALLTAVTARSKLLKAHAAKLDAYVKTVFGHVNKKQQPNSDLSQSHKLDTQGADTDRVIFYSYTIRVEGEDKEHRLDTITPTIEGVRDRLSNMIPEITLTSIEQLKKTWNDEKDVKYMESDVLDWNGIAGCPVCKRLDSGLNFANAGQIVGVYLCTIHRYVVFYSFESAHFLHPENIYQAGLCINFEDLVESGFKDEKHFSCE